MHIDQLAVAIEVMISISARMHRFEVAHTRTLVIDRRAWHYYRLGTGPAVLLLPGGLRRASYSFDVMERIAQRHTIVAPDLPSATSFHELAIGFERILDAEGITRVSVCGQSYGGLLAQAFVARRPEIVDRLILSSTGPADYGRSWLLVQHLVMPLVRLMPDRIWRTLLSVMVARLLTVPEAQRAEWQIITRRTVEYDLTRADLMSHFAVLTDMIRNRVVQPAAYQRWRGAVVVLVAVNDPTQHAGDRARFNALFGRAVELVDLGTLGHTAALMDPEFYASCLEQALLVSDDGHSACM